MMRRVLVLVILVVVGLGVGSSGWAAPASPAAIRTVGTSALCNFSSIKDAIAAADPGDTIRMEIGIFTESPLKIAKNLTLEGGYPIDPGGCLDPPATGVTVVHRSGPSTARILEVKGASVAISDMYFELNTNGGGLSALDNTDLTLQDVTVTSNQADWGAGLLVVNSTATMTDCMVSYNQATTGGGGLGARGTDQASTINLTRVHFVFNEAVADGGGIYLQDGAQVTTNEWVWFDVNEAGGHGGGVYLTDGAKLTFNAHPDWLSYMMGNAADGHGGAIYADGSMVVLNGVLGPSDSERLHITSNIADADNDNSGNGGGIFATNGATVQADKTLIADGKAVNGGGLGLSGSVLTASDVYVSKNSAEDNGGGIWVTDGSTVTLSEGSQVSDWLGTQENTADNGAGIYADGGSTVSLDNSEIGGNRAFERGGGAYIADGSTFHATNDASIERNEVYAGGTDGGGIYATGTDTEIRIDASQVATNTAITKGAGLYVGGGAKATIDNGSLVWGSTILDPVTGSGAGAWIAGPHSSLTVRNSEFYENYAAANGGGFYNDGGRLNIYSSLVYGNNARESGGGIFNNQGTLTIDWSTFSGNTATNGKGGGIYTVGPDGPVNIADSSLFLNKATIGDGGAIATFGSKLSVRRSILTTNSSQHEGSAIYADTACCPDPPAIYVANCNILDNHTLPLNIQGPPGRGSSVYVQNVPAILTHNTLARQTEESFGVYVADGSTVTMTNNIISNFVVGIRRPFAGTGVGLAEYTLFHDNQFDYDTAGITIDTIIPGDPAFAGPGDYHLTETSAAINAGKDSGVGLDFDRESRPWDGGYDVGADEYPDRGHVYIPVAIR